MSDGMVAVVLVLTGSCFLYWILTRNVPSQDTRAAAQNAIKEFREFVEELQRTRVIPRQEDPVFLALRYEFIALRHLQSTMQEYRSARLSEGVGTRIKIAGIPIYLGGAKSRPADELPEVAQGTLYLTNRRLVFMGDARTLVLGIDDILSFDNGLDWICVQSARCQKPAIFTVPNGYFWAGMFQLLVKLRPDIPRLEADTIAPPREKAKTQPLPRIIRGKGKLFDP